MLVTDERGGGILPVGASCTQGADNTLGNGGIHAFPVDKLGTAPPEPTGARHRRTEAYQEEVYAKNSDGERAIFRTPTRREPQGSLCTSHVFQQIPGQNRIFMGWYSQGTQVVDFTENADGTIDFERAGFFVPEHANQWTSHVFKVEENPDGSFTYWGATGDFLLGDAGRNAIDVYKATLPRTAQAGRRGRCPARRDSRAAPVTKPARRASGFDSISAKPRKNRKRVRFSFRPRGQNRVTAKVFRQSTGRRIARKRVKTFRGRTGRFTWKPRRARNGFYDVRFTRMAPNGKKDVRHVSVRRKRGRFFKLPAFDRRSTCSFVSYYSLGRSVFGGRKRKPLRVRFTARRATRRSGSWCGAATASSSAGSRRRATTRARAGVRIRLGRKAKRGAYRDHAQGQRARARQRADAARALPVASRHR